MQSASDRHCSGMSRTRLATTEFRSELRYPEKLEKLAYLVLKVVVHRDEQHVVVSMLRKLGKKLSVRSHVGHPPHTKHASCMPPEL